jgi:radical SAM superfamily enzyme YgiQ (UPF0313 family)
MKRLRALLINPWIYDFKAYDLWAKPLGLYALGTILKKWEFEVEFIDCLNRFDQDLHQQKDFLWFKQKEWGTGQYYYEEVQKPLIFKDIPRKYKRYGIPIEIFKQKLLKIQPPDVVFITSLMTYWYQGVFQAVEIVKETLGDIPVVLGGIYVTLCPDHAKLSGADFVIPGPAEKNLKRFLEDFFGKKLDDLLGQDFLKNERIFFNFQSKYSYIPLLTSRGCPFRCTYCASYILWENFVQRDPDLVVEDIIFYIERFGIKDFAFYDDALLVNPDFHIKRILKKLIERGIECNFHTPNGLHAKFIDEDLAKLMHCSGFKIPRLSLETSNLIQQRLTGNKVSNKDMVDAIKNLKKAGFADKEIGVYVMVGWPNEQYEDIVETIKFLQSLKVKIYLAEYSPIPRTYDFESLKNNFPDLIKEPLTHNNLAWVIKRYALKHYQTLKDIIRKHNQTLKD